MTEERLQEIERVLAGVGTLHCDAEDIEDETRDLLAEVRRLRKLAQDLVDVGWRISECCGCSRYELEEIIEKSDFLKRTG